MKHSDYLKKKKTRETRKKIISVISAIVVFVTTYALVLPAITLDVSKASQEPGIAFEQMQFKATAAAASVTAADSTVEVQVDEAQVEEPADEAPAEETIQEEPAESSEEEASAVSDEQEEIPAEPEQEEIPAEPEQVETPAEPEQEEAPAAEAETKEVQADKSADSEPDAAPSSEPAHEDAQTAETQKAAEQTAVDQSGTGTTDAATTAETAAEFQIPALDALDFDDLLTGKTAFYYYHPENAEEAESLSSDSIDDWKKAGSDTVLAPEDFVRVYLSYEIQAGALNETNTEARYRLPAGLELSDKQIEAINKYENGIAASKSGSEHDKYLGAEAIEGSRTPDEKAGDEYISATVKVEKTHNDRQELVFTFIPYTVEKNQISYDEAGKLASEGRNVKGFFTFDLITAQIDFEKTELETVEKEDGTTEEIQYSKAEVVFVKENNDKNIDEISSTLTLAAPVRKEEPKTLISVGSDYTVTVSYTEAAQIPDNAELAVREIEKDSEEYASYLEKAKGAVDETKYVNEARFFDITILVDGEKVEPQAPVSVQINFTGIEQTNTDDTQLLHYKNDKEVEVMDKAEFSKSEEPENDAKAVDTVQFEADGFSVYGIVGMELNKEITLTTPDGKDVTYVVSVTYGPDADIPEGSSLKVSEFEEGSDKYNEAKKAVIADKIARNDTSDINTFDLAALDISILDPNGKEIEPKAKVQVELKIKKLPRVEDLEEVEDTLAVQHHVETEDGVVVETVYAGGSDAGFQMDTDEKTKDRGTVVQPETIDLSKYGVSDFGLYDDGSMEPNSPEQDLDVSFDTGVFSTFTITWVAKYNIGGTIVRRINELTNGTYIVAADIITNNQHRYYALQPDQSAYRIGELDGQTPAGNTTVNLSSVPAGALWTYNQTQYGTNSRTGTLQSNTTTNYLNLGSSNFTSDTARGLSFTSGTWTSTDHLRIQRDQYYLHLNNDTQFDRSSTSGTANTDRTHLVFIRVNQSEGLNSVATIHYVDESEGDLTVSKGSISNSTLLNNMAYLIYDIEGGEYEYKKTFIRRSSTDTDIRAYLQWNGTNWQYYSGNSWHNVEDDDEIYVVYKKKATPPEGGTPTLVELTDENRPDPPTVTKDSDSNGDGTNTISLTVTSHTKPREVLKLADVIVIFDKSGSMKKEIDSDSDTDVIADRRMTLLRNAVNSLADSLIGDDSEYIYTDPNGVKHKQIEMSLVSFSNSATNATAFTDDASTFKGYVNELEPDGGTNWEYALQKANEASIDSGRATFVIFVTDGEPTFRVTRMTDADNDLNGDFYTNTYYNNYNVYGTGSSDNSKDGTEHGRNYRSALAQAQSIVGKNKNLYMIGVGPEVNNLDQFHKDAGAQGYYKAESADALTEAFEDIKKQIAALSGFADFQIDDGITNLSNTIEKSGLTNVDEKSFVYYKKAKDSDQFVEWTAEQRTAEGCADAKYENGSVNWDMGATFFPEDGVTYRVDFIVWPKQEAFDILANINNASNPDAYYNSLEESVRKQITKSGNRYVLKTNEDTAGYSYYAAAQTGNGVQTEGEKQTGTFDPVIPLNLDVEKMLVEKAWIDSINDRNRANEVEFYLKDEKGYYQKDGSFSMTLTGNEYILYARDADIKNLENDHDTPIWMDDVNIAPGFMLVKGEGADRKIEVLEEGHSFELLEKAAHKWKLKKNDGGDVIGYETEGGNKIDEYQSYSMDFKSRIVRPMVINGELTYLVKVGSDDHTGSDYTIDGEQYYVLSINAGDAAAVGTNYKTPELDLTKSISPNSLTNMTPAQLDEQEFTYEVTFNFPQTGDNSGVAYWIYSKTDGSYGWTLPEYNGIASGYKPDGYHSEDKYYEESAHSIWDGETPGSSKTISITMKRTQVVRFTNLPVGTTYTIVETKANGQALSTEGYSVENIEASATSKTIDTDAATITGTVDALDTRYYNRFTNFLDSVGITIVKTDDNAKPLSGAVFELSKNVNGAWSKVGDNLPVDKRLEISNLAYGPDILYRLSEIQPPSDGYVITVKTVYFYIEKNESAVVITMADQDGNRTHVVDSEEVPVSYENWTAEGSTITVVNPLGKELPMTGGSGTFLYTLSGIALIMASAWMYGFRMRRRERRLK